MQRYPSPSKYIDFADDDVSFASEDPVAHGNVGA